MSARLRAMVGMVCHCGVLESVFRHVEVAVEVEDDCEWEAATSSV